MNLIATAATLALLAAGSAQAAPPDPLGPAHQGKGQCYAPNPAKKTCESIGWYSFVGDGTILNTAQVRLPDPDHRVVMTTHAPVTLRGEAVCGVIQAADLAAATFTIDGKPAPDNQAAGLHEIMRIGMQPSFGVEYCTTFRPDGATLKAEVTTEGRPIPALTQPVIWVTPGEGYTVGR